MLVVNEPSVAVNELLVLFGNVKGSSCEVSVGTILMLGHDLGVNGIEVSAFVLLDQVHSFQVSKTVKTSAGKGVCGSYPSTFESSPDEGLTAILVVRDEMRITSDTLDELDQAEVRVEDLRTELQEVNVLRNMAETYQRALELNLCTDLVEVESAGMLSELERVGRLIAHVIRVEVVQVQRAVVGVHRELIHFALPVRVNILNQVAEKLTKRFVSDCLLDRD